MNDAPLTTIAVNGHETPVYLMGKPRVALVARPSLAVSLTNADHLASMGIRKLKTPPGNQATDAEILCELGGRRCYESYSNPGAKTSRDYLHHILSLKHGSVLEHAFFVFHIWRVSRGLSHELVRHRAGTSFSQLSTRYVDHLHTPAVEPLALLCPPTIWNNEGARNKWLQARRLDLETYAANLESLLPKQEGKPDTALVKNARQAARSGLPTASETRLQFGANIRSLIHILDLRGSEGADFEIRALAVEILHIMQKEAPIVFDSFKTTRLEDGSEAIGVPWGKV